MVEAEEQGSIPSTGWYCWDCGIVHPASDPECPVTHRPRPKGWRTGDRKPFGPVWK